MQFIIGVGFIAVAFALSFAVLKVFVVLTGLPPAALAIPIFLIALAAWVSSEV